MGFSISFKLLTAIVLILKINVILTEDKIVKQPRVPIPETQSWVNLDPDSEYALGKPFPAILSDGYAENSSIFVSIAAFRDGKRCGRTVYSLFSTADNPKRVFVAITDQHQYSDPADVDCVIEFCRLMTKFGIKGSNLTESEVPDPPANHHNHCFWADHIRVRPMDWRDAAGPIYARATVQTLRDDEEYCLTLDSHTEAIAHWDTKILEDWAKINNEYAVISTYIHGFGSGMDWMYNPNKDYPILCRMEVSVNGNKRFLRNARAHAAYDLYRPKLSMLWAAGLSFSKCHMEDAVPTDINLRFVWDGEEFTKMTRLWTSGYDVYAPSVYVFYHDYDHIFPNKFDWITNLNAEQHAAREVALEYAYGIQTGSDKLVGKPFGLGTCRSFDKWASFSGVDFEKIEGPSNFSRCLDLSWVPYDISCIRNNINLKNKWAKEQKILGISAAAQNANFDDQFSMADKLELDELRALRFKLSSKIASLENELQSTKSGQEGKKLSNKNGGGNNNNNDEENNNQQPPKTSSSRSPLWLFFVFLGVVVIALALMAILNTARPSRWNDKTSKIV